MRHAQRMSAPLQPVHSQMLTGPVPHGAQKAPPPPVAPGCSLCSMEFKRRHQVPATVYHGAALLLPTALAWPSLCASVYVWHACTQQSAEPVKTAFNNIKSIPGGTGLRDDVLHPSAVHSIVQCRLACYGDGWAHLCCLCLGVKHMTCFDGFFS